ncbi:hypothetical protein [Vibrio sonorensis]|uniref:hypothetical protein n=1 Tax=Vibrio sonorensis TaxID=1004316 RepID=UPI0015869C4C|nr:hypothetical protein [Vibrio sonorensis]
MTRDDNETKKERQRQGIELAKERGKCKDRQANTDIHQQIIALRNSNLTIGDDTSIS